MLSGSDRAVLQSVDGGGGDDSLHAWRERPRLWPRAWAHKEEWFRPFLGQTRIIDASGRGNYDLPAQHEGLTTWCSGRAHTHRFSVRRAHRLSPKGHGPPTATK